MITYMTLKFIQLNSTRIQAFTIRKKYAKMTFVESTMYPTFVFDDDIECDFTSDVKFYSATEFADTCNGETEYDWSKDTAVTKKRLLLRDERDPSLAESRLDFEFDFKSKTNSKNHETVRRNKNQLIFNEFETLSVEDKTPFTDKILSPDKDGDNLLFIAIIAKRTNLSLLLIDLISHYSRLKVFNKLYQTALHLAALTESVEVVRRLVVAGIDVELRDRAGNTALHIACRKGSLEVVEALVTAVTYQETKLNTYEIPYQPIPQNFDIRNSEGLTCLHVAVIHKHRDIVALLLSKNANVNAIEMKAGKTCLHIAAESGNDAIVELILSKSRPKLSARTFTGYTATELAHYRGHDHIVYILRCKGALAARPIDTIEKPKLEDDDILDEFDVEDDYDDDYDEDRDSENDDCWIID